MQNDVFAAEKQNLKDFEEAPRTSAFSQRNLYTHQDNDHGTFNNESSVVLNEHTSQFDLYKGFFFVFISCLFKTFFSLFCRILLEKNKTITSFHLLAYKVYIMLGITIILCLFILYTYYINTVDNKNEGDEKANKVINNYSSNNNHNKININNTNNYLNCSNISKYEIDVSTNFNSHMNSEKDMIKEDKAEAAFKEIKSNGGHPDSDKNLLMIDERNQNLNTNLKITMILLTTKQIYLTISITIQITLII